jgi:hypothetical protein
MVSNDGLQATIGAAAGGAQTGAVSHGSRRCKLCSEVKPCDDFCVSSGGWHAWYCEQCKVRYVRKGFRLGLKMDQMRDAYQVFDQLLTSAFVLNVPHCAKSLS